MTSFPLRVLLLALLVSAAARAEVAVPALQERVTDLTGTLDAQQVRTLEARLAKFEQQKGAQLAVLIVPNTQPETIEQYSIRVAEAWKLGRKGVDDGAILLVAKDDHAVRVEVGYGLEGVMPDAIAKRITDDVVIPYFKRGEFYGGIDAGLSAMMQVINGEPLPPPKTFGGTGKYDIESLLFVAFALVVVVGGILRAVLGRIPAAVLTGGGLGFLAWITVAPLLVAILVGFLAFVFVLFGGIGRGFSGYTGGRWGGGWGGFGGGGFGGGGFSGGGGGFGGGGATGRW